MRLNKKDDNAKPKIEYKLETNVILQQTKINKLKLLISIEMALKCFIQT